MGFDRFAADYGTLPASYFDIGRISNPAELLRGEELYRLLRLCGVPETENGDRASDWELLRSLCHAMPLLGGHPMKKQISDFFATHFSITVPLNEENHERIWRDTVADLERHPRNASAFLKGNRAPWLCETLDLTEQLPQCVKPVLLGNLFCEHRKATLAQWQTYMRDTVRKFIQTGCEKVVFRLGREFSFVTPSVYQIERILPKKRTATEEKCLLSAQVFRELCAICVENQLSLLLELQCDFSAAEKLLSYAKNTVGLPLLYVTAPDLATTDRLIDLMEIPGQHPMRLALRLEEYPSEEEMVRACQRIGARYPVGRLSVITAADLRRIDIAQEHFLEIFRKMF